MSQTVQQQNALLQTKSSFKQKKTSIDSSNSSSMPSGYLLKVNQVPVSEFLKLRMNHDHKREIEEITQHKKMLSQRRYQELTSQYTCNNRDTRLIIQKGGGANDRQKVRSRFSSNLGNITNKSGIFTHKHSSFKDTSVGFNSVKEQQKGEFTEFSKYMFSAENQTLQNRKGSPKRKKIQFQEGGFSSQKVDALPFSMDESFQNQMDKNEGGRTENNWMNNSYLKNNRDLSNFNDFNDKNRQSQQFMSKRASDSSNHKLCFSHDKSTSLDKQQIFQRNSLAHDFIATGMGKRFKQLLQYNSLKYSKQSPRGKEIRLLSANPDLQNMNLSKYLTKKQSLRKSRLQTPLEDYQDTSYQNSDRKDSILRPLLMSDTFHSPKTNQLFSPVKNSRGEYHCFKDVDYDNWFSSKLRQMKDVNILKQDCQKKKSQNYRQMKNYCNSKGRYFSQPCTPLMSQRGAPPELY